MTPSPRGERWTARELNFMREAASASELAESMTAEPDFVIPAVDWQRSTAKVLTIEWIDGVKLTDRAALTAAGFEVLLDDRDKKTSPGIKFADMELIGIPHRIVVSDRGLAEGNLEYKHRTEQDAQALPLNEVLSFLQARVRR